MYKIIDDIYKSISIAGGLKNQSICNDKLTYNFSASFCVNPQRYRAGIYHFRKFPHGKPVVHTYPPRSRPRPSRGSPGIHGPHHVPAPPTPRYHGLAGGTSTWITGTVSPGGRLPWRYQGRPCRGGAPGPRTLTRDGFGGCRGFSHAHGGATVGHVHAPRLAPLFVTGPRGARDGSPLRSPAGRGGATPGLSP